MLLGMGVRLCLAHKIPDRLQLAGRSLGQLLAQELERSAVGLPGEELVAVDQAEQRHGLAPQRMDDVVVVDDMAVLAVGTTAAALQRHQQGRAQQQLQPLLLAI